jgi:hypothetical protein
MLGVLNRAIKELIYETSIQLDVCSTQMGGQSIFGSKQMLLRQPAFRLLANTYVNLFIWLRKLVEILPLTESSESVHYRDLSKRRYRVGGKQ